MDSICTECGREMQPEWKACPFCGVAVQTGKPPSIDIRDSVVKELHQTQKTDARSSGGMSIGGGISIAFGGVEGQADSSSRPEVIYEEYVLTILRSGGALEQARPQLNEIRHRLQLTLKQANDVEQQCIAIFKPGAQQVDRTRGENHIERIGFEDVYEYLRQYHTEDELDWVKQVSKELAQTLSTDQWDRFMEMYEWIIDYNPDLDEEKFEKFVGELARKLSIDQFYRFMDIYDWFENNLAFTSLNTEVKAREFALNLSEDQINLLKEIWTWACEEAHLEKYEGIKLAEALVLKATHDDFTRLKAFYEKAVSFDDKEPSEALKYARRQTNI